MKKKTIYIDELYHHGVKGMKWGVRKQQSQSLGYIDGSKRTERKLNKALMYDKKAGPNQTARQTVKVHRMIKSYDRSAQRDINRAIKVKDFKSARSVASGRTYMKIMTDSKYLNGAMADAAHSAGVKAGERYTASVTRNKGNGGIDITINGKSTSSYSYLKGNEKHAKKYGYGTFDLD